MALNSDVEEYIKYIIRHEKKPEEFKIESANITRNLANPLPSTVPAKVNNGTIGGGFKAGR